MCASCATSLGFRLVGTSCRCNVGFYLRATPSPTSCQACTAQPNCATSTANACATATAIITRRPCTQASAGYRLLGTAPNGVPTANVCTCTNGSPATGAACTTHNAAICRACNANYHRTNTNNVWTGCAANTCTCANGVGRSGSACPTNNAALCASCNTGFHANSGNTACVANVCTCPNGQVRTGTACTTHSTVMCVSCNTGFHGATCSANVCTCNNGTPSTGISCTEHGATMCASCNPGYHSIQNRICVVNVCYCDNGIRATGASCTAHNTNLCATCSTGHVRNDTGCTVQSNGQRGADGPCRRLTDLNVLAMEEVSAASSFAFNGLLLLLSFLLVLCSSLA